MSQVTSPTASFRGQVRSHRILGVSALLALLATAAVVLVLAIEDGATDKSSVTVGSQAALRSDGGPDETAVAASVAQSRHPAVRIDGGPEESAVAASVGTAQPAPERAYVSESRIAASIAGH
jgi:hypothetical protein